MGRKYDYKYDNVNRLTRAEFPQNTSGSTWDTNALNSCVWGFNSDNGYGTKCDANGNILMMIQSGSKAKSTGWPLSQESSCLFLSNHFCRVLITMFCRWMIICCCDNFTACTSTIQVATTFHILTLFISYFIRSISGDGIFISKQFIWSLRTFASLNFLLSIRNRKK